ncbi:MAG: glycosyltransferase family 1 protein [Phycisphaerae bacterium]
MRIGIDASSWSNKRGFGRFTRELLTALARNAGDDEIVLLVDRQTADASQFPVGWKLIVADTTVAPTQAAAADGRRSLRDMWAMRRAAAREPVDVFYFPAVYTYFPLAGDVPCIVTFHDVIAETLPRLVFHNRLSRFFWNAKCRLALRRSTLVATVSQASKRGLMAHFRLPEQRLRVLPEASSATFAPVDERDPAHDAVLQKHGLRRGERFFVYFGGISPHKNLATLIDAFAAMRVHGGARNVKLVLVGDYAGDVFRTCHDELCQQARTRGVEDGIRFPGWVSDADLCHLLAAAEAFVFPSFLEGFGLPAVEAMACGAAVIASDRGSLPEVVGDAGLLVNPDRPLELANAMSRVLGDTGLRANLRSRGLARASQFSWDHSARALRNVLHELGDRPVAG